VIPKENKDADRVEELLNKNLHNSELLGEAIEFTKSK